MILGTHCVLKIRPRDTLGPSIKIICLAIIQTSHDTCQTVPYRTVPLHVAYRTVRYRTVQTTYGQRKYMSQAGIEPAFTSNKVRLYLGSKPWLIYCTVQKSTVLWKNKRTDHLPVR